MTSQATIRGGGKPEAYLDAWHLVSTPVSYHLVGVVFGHVRLLDGALVVTSDLVDVHVLPGQRIRVETVNTLYALSDAMCADLPAEYRLLLDELLGHDWQSVSRTAH